MAQFREDFTTASPVVATFDFNDVADGTGFVVINGANAINSAGTTYFLTPNSVESGSVTAHSSSNQNIDYDIAFNTPKDVKGTAIINMTMGANAVASVDIHMTVAVTLIHYDGSTETIIGATQISTQLVAVQAAAKESRRICFKMPIISQQHFAAGDILRLTVTSTKTQGSGQYGWGHDPAKRNDDAETSANQILEDKDNSNLEVQVPFLLNL